MALGPLDDLGLVDVFALVGDEQRHDGATG